MSVFHLAYTVNDLDSTRRFYGDLLGCQEGRSTESWVDFDFFGNQLSLHIGQTIKELESDSRVDNVEVPLPHFGCVIDWDLFHNLADKLKSAGILFIIEPTIRFEGMPGEQATMFLEDYSQNALEFKSFRNPNEVFSQ
ncbi:MAG: VOC family protein [Candidatus Pseudothioglobus sp.]|mgnify:FL=1|jgi:extradiol dioxygenase family protein|nr:dioxygenase [Candidatus Thioglobus sp.]